MYTCTCTCMHHVICMCVYYADWCSGVETASHAGHCPINLVNVQ